MKPSKLSKNAEFLPVVLARADAWSLDDAGVMDEPNRRVELVQYTGDDRFGFEVRVFNEDGQLERVVEWEPVEDLGLDVSKLRKEAFDSFVEHARSEASTLFL